MAQTTGDQQSRTSDPSPPLAPVREPRADARTHRERILEATRRAFAERGLREAH